MEGGVHPRLSPDAIKILLSASSVDPRSYAYEATPLFDPYLPFGELLDEGGLAHASRALHQQCRLAVARALPLE